MHQERKVKVSELLNNSVEMAHEKPWPLNLHAMVIGSSGIPFDKKVELNERAEGVMLQALHVLSPIEERCMLKLYREQKPWEEICDELTIDAAELCKHYLSSIRRLRGRDVRDYIMRQGVLAWESGPLPEPVSLQKYLEETL